MGSERFGDYPQNKLDERRATRFTATYGNRLIILLLILIYNVFDRQVFEDRPPPAQNQGLPQSPRTTVTVRKRMDKLEFIMKDTTCDQRVFIRDAQPLEQIVYEKRHTFGIGRIMDNRFPRHHTRTAFAETTDFVDQSRLHRGVSL